MKLSRRNKRKHMDKAAGMLPEGAGEPIDYVLGGGGAWPPRLLAWSIAGALLAVSVLLSVATGGVTVIGVLPALAVFYGLNNPRGVLVASGGVATLSCGFFNGRPNRLLAWDTWECLGREATQRAGSTRIVVGQDAVWVADKDLASLRSAVQPTSGI